VTESYEVPESWEFDNKPIVRKRPVLAGALQDHVIYTQSRLLSRVFSAWRTSVERKNEKVVQMIGECYGTDD
jgi:hypothetical protein